MMNDDDFKLLRGFSSERTDRLTDICECRVAFVTENQWSISYMNCAHIMESSRDHLLQGRVKIFNSVQILLPNTSAVYRKKKENKRGV